MKQQKKSVHYVSVYQLSVLLTNLLLASNDKDVGYNDADIPLKKFLYQYRDMRVPVTTEDLERLLYPCNMLNERRRFWHPTSISFEKFWRACVSKAYNFDKLYNRIIKREKKEQK